MRITNNSSVNRQIRECIEYSINMGKRKFVLFPYGDIGMLADDILKRAYGITASYRLDNTLCKYKYDIKPVSFLRELSSEDYTLLLCSINEEIYDELRNSVLRFYSNEAVIELPSMKEAKRNHKKTENKRFNTKVGKYSYGPLCDHPWVESVGSFCSINETVDVVVNKPLDYVSLSPFLFADKNVTFNCKDYEEYSGKPWYFPGVKPLYGDKTRKRITIGNDVWLGKNVVITNYSNIGNGVIAGAGAVITKDVPDYAIVVGAPARILRFRYSETQIKILNEIKWWDWTDDIIRERYEDFYLPIEEFVEKYGELDNK